MTEETPLVDKRRLPIYYFYEKVPNNEEGKPGEPGNKHYCCYHGLQSHLKNHFPAMNQLYETLKSCPAHQPSTVEELRIAAGQLPMDSLAVANYIKTIESKTSPLIDAFNCAAAKSESPQFYSFCVADSMGSEAVQDFINRVGHHMQSTFQEG
ncbi:hypothetical protein M422DRAFT_43511 [Sphaerobolus stellatus SS14]|nr:hypothetical protein M422DRAFT_43511 [Sphaerobolus stellatus SS14]